MKNLAYGCLILLLTILSSCSTPNPFKKIKKLAVVSVYGNQDIFIKKTGIVSVKKTRINSFSKKHRIILSRYAVKVLHRSLASIIEWKVISHKKTIRNKKYKSIIKKRLNRSIAAAKSFGIEEDSGLGRLIKRRDENISRARYIYPKRMFPFPVPAKEEREKMVMEIKSFSDLGNAFKGEGKAKNMVPIHIRLNNIFDTDAVIVLQFELAYTAATWGIGATGQAKAIAATRIKIVERDGTHPVKLPDLSASTDKELFSYSHNTVGMVNGKLFFGRDVLRLYKQALKVSIQKTVNELKRKVERL